METTTTETKSTSSGASAAADIRAALKAAFGGFRFGVRTERSGTVRVSWVDGPAIDAVDAIVGRFEDGHFDGMADIYVHAPEDASTPNRARYVFTHRDLSDRLCARVTAEMRAQWSTVSEFALERDVYQLLRRTDLRRGYGGLHFSNDRGWEIIEGLVA
jgi:hypothetical protein